jgi:hypothetical protein
LSRPANAVRGRGCTSRPTPRCRRTSRSRLSQAGLPSIRQYLDENKFNQFKIVDGNVNWNDYELIFPVEDLYAGKI